MDVIPLLSEFGFPVVISLYLLHRIEKKLDLLTESINNLPKNLHSSYYHHLQGQKKFK